MAMDGSNLCKKKCVKLLEKLHLPHGLLPLLDLLEVGRNKVTGFVWLWQQSMAMIRDFKKIKKMVSYAMEDMGSAEDCRMKRMIGVKSKELLIWFLIFDMLVANPEGEKIAFKTTSRLGRAFPFFAFEEEGEE
ncbi:At5g01610-like protein [Dioscorea alata]|uniref:At5g01610-like protein n=1 Tax=Dioscorea alata TaxID=55571 RepID=A0ACB7UZ13_DIOAL|nr:At5g01610-like protein [Dioscorea alata]